MRFTKSTVLAALTMLAVIPFRDARASGELP